jgi:hypothetical protein
MTETAHGDPVPLDLSPREAWVAHAAVLDALERAAEEGEETRCWIGLLEAVEGDQTFTPDELRSLRSALRVYLEDAPDRDHGVGRSVLDTLDATLA